MATDDDDLTIDPPYLPQLDIPASLRTSLLPSFWLSGLVQFETLPPACTISSNNSPSPPPETWLSDQPVSPNFEPTILTHTICLPPPEIIEQLYQIIADRRDTPPTSILPLHVPSADLAAGFHLPVWTVAYWREVSTARDHRGDWSAAVKWVERLAKGSEEGEDLQKRILSVFRKLQWRGSVSGVTVGRTVRGLSKFLGNTPLPAEQVLQLVDLLQLQLTLTAAPDSPHLLVSENFIGALLKAAKLDPKSPTPPHTQIAAQRCYSALREVESDVLFRSKRVVSGILFVGGNHWTFFVLNFNTQTIGYGDSFAGSMPSDIEKAFVWWINRLSRFLNMKHQKPAEEWSRQAMPVTRQKAGDAYSCGILAVNGLENYLFNSGLVSPDPRAIARRRMRCFLEVCRLHCESVSTYQYPIVYHT